MKTRLIRREAAEARRQERDEKRQRRRLRRAELRARRASASHPSDTNADPRPSVPVEASRAGQGRHPGSVIAP